MKKIVALLLALVLAMTLMACGGEKEPSATTELKKFTVTVVHSDGTEKTFTYESGAENLGPVLQEEGLIKGEDDVYGLVITEVDGEEAIYDRDKAYWAVYVGEEYGLNGIDTTPITDGGVYKLVYTLG